MTHLDPAGTRQVRGHVAVELDAAWLDRSIYLVVKTWKGAEAEYHQKTNWHSLNLTIGGGTCLTGARVGGELIYEGLDSPGALTFVPAQADRHGWAMAADMRLVGLYFHPRIADRLLEADLAAEIAPRVNDRDPLLHAHLALLSQELKAGDVPELALIEHTIGLIVRRLIKRAPEIDAPRTRCRRLSSKVLQQIAEYVDAHLSDKMSLSELAAFANMPAFRFSRDFKLSTGLAPHQYILRRRVRRAEHLLANTNIPISEIAFTTGFSSQSHLTNAFTRFAGQPPKAYRRYSRS